MGHLKNHRRSGLFALVLLMSGVVGAAVQPASGQVSEDPQELFSGQAFIRPGDYIRVFIDREPSMSGEFLVDAAGFVVFPRIGEVRVIEETAESLEAKLVSEYRVFLRSPAIEVTVLRRVNITGSVGRPGVYNLDPTMTISDALAEAGGVTPQGDRDDIQILRDGQRLTTRLGEQTAIGESIIRSGDQIYVPERSWVARNAAVVAATITAVSAILIAAFINK
jgi:polysaccharide export outer membrane protein